MQVIYTVIISFGPLSVARRLELPRLLCCSFPKINSKIFLNFQVYISSEIQANKDCLKMKILGEMLLVGDLLERNKFEFEDMGHFMAQESRLIYYFMAWSSR